MKKALITVGVLVVIVVAYVVFVLGNNSFEMCGDAMTTARNMFTKKCQTFNTTCIPWYFTNDFSCDGLGTRAVSREISAALKQ
jgi:hypothetical protein